MKWPKLKYMDLIVCHWHDITSNDGWVPIEEAKQVDMLRPVTCGFLLSETKDVVRLTSTFLPESCSVIIIPKSNIDKVIKLASWEE